MEGGSDHDLLSLETTSTKGEEDKNEEGNKEEGKLAEGEGGEGTSTSQFPPPTPSLPFSLSSLFSFSCHSFPLSFVPLYFLLLPSISFPTLVSVPPFLPHLSLPPLSTIFPSPLGKPSFMIMEPTEEQRQLAEQARTYGKHMVALQSGEGGEGGPPTPVQDEPVTEPAQSVRDGKQKPTGLVMSAH